MAYISFQSAIPADRDGEPLSAPVKAALGDLRRDIAKTCSAPVSAAEASGSVRIALHLEKRAKETFSVALSSDERTLTVGAADDLGFVYGIYHISRELLGVSDFWFWNDQCFNPRAQVPVPAGYRYESSPRKVRFRGWFINDEVLINTWQVEGRADFPWIMAFEALLRLGGNMVIPGTDRNSRRYRALASSRGLYITHHHAEPLGAEMFIRAYPDLQPSYKRYPEKFESLWQKSIEEQRGMNVVWNLGFRGQGDYPFWHNDPSYDTDEKRGALVSSLIKLQYDMVKKANPDAACCTNLYGEVMELYEKGFLSLPDDVIKIWADNGFGKMVSRRQGNHNPRVPSMPDAAVSGGKGIYYHVSFYDLQAANHITMLPNSAEFVTKELSAVLENGGSDYWIVNCSNIKPHVYFLDAVSDLWTRGVSGSSAHDAAKAHAKRYVARYYGSRHCDDIVPLFEDYASCAAPYGPNEDDHAGEQFPNHVLRMLITQFMKNRTARASSLLWAADMPTLTEQIAWFKDISQRAAMRYKALVRKGEALLLILDAEAADSAPSTSADSAGDALAASASKMLLEDSLMLHSRVYAHCYEGAAKAAEALLTALSGDEKRAFYLAGKARACYRAADAALRAREHGKWHGFYANECFAGLKHSANMLSALMSYLRIVGDGPESYRWQREFCYSEADRNVVTLLLWENQLTDDELFAAMEARLDR